MATDPAQDILTPTLTQLLQRVRSGAVVHVNAVSWGQVESYNAALQEATVQIVPRRVWVDTTGSRQTQRRAQLLDVPVFLPGSGASGVTFTINPGDFVLLLFLDQAADTWFRTGGNDADPGDPRRHSLSDAIAIPGMRPRPNRLSPPPANLVLQDPSKVQLGSASASEDAVLGSTYRASEDILFTAISTFVAALSTFAGFCTGPTTPQLTALTTAATALEAAVTTFKSSAASYLSAKVKLE